MPSMTRSTTAMPVFGPPATWRELGSEKNFGKLLEYECGLEEMFRDLPALSGVRQYHRDTLPDDVTQRPRQASMR